MSVSFAFPDQLDLIEWFSSEPRELREGTYLFTATDAFGVTLRFSYDVFEASIQTVLSIVDEEVVKVVHECVKRLWLQDSGGKRRLLAECFRSGLRTNLVIEIEPRIRIKWSTLQTEWE